MKSLCIIDDDVPFGRRLALSFEKRGYQASYFPDGASACTAAAAGGFDGAVVDLRLEGESGIEVVGRLRAISSAMPIVVITGYGSIATAKQALREGAIDYLTKPTDAVEIERALLQLAAPPSRTSPAAEPPVPSLKRVEWEHLQRVLADTGGNISEAARRLGIERRTLQRKLFKYPPD